MARPIAAAIFLALVALASASSLPDGDRFRHSRFHKLDYLFHKISKLNEPTPADTDTNYIAYPKADSIGEHEYKQRYAEEPIEDDDIFPDEDADYDEEEQDEKIKMILKADQNPQKELIEEYIQTMLPEDEGELSDDPVSKEEYDQEPEFSPQATAATTPVVKWRYFGTRKELGPPKATVPKMKQSELYEAIAHAVKMTKESVCKTPQRRVVDIQSVHPNPSKTYIPHCTILHRCGDDTGCCKTGSMTCVPKTMKIVQLYFYTKIIGQGTKAEKLNFSNHTECECVSRTMDYMIKDETVAALSTRPAPNVRQVPEMVTTDEPIAIKRCQCPTEFSVHIFNNGECECDCSARQRACIRIKRGREYLGMNDRICIQSGQCQTPWCEFGNYNVSVGRCPRKNERPIELFKISRSSRSK